MNPAPIDRLLSLWRAARHPSTSDLIHRIADSLVVEVTRLPAKKAAAVRVLASAFKSEPSFMLSARLRQVVAFSRTTSASLLWPLFEALAKLPADPRIATLATRMLVGEVEVQLTSKFTRRLLDCVENHGDDSHFRELELGFALNLVDDRLAARTVRLLQRGLAARPTGAASAILATPPPIRASRSRATGAGCHDVGRASGRTADAVAARTRVGFPARCCAQAGGG